MRRENTDDLFDTPTGEQVARYNATGRDRDGPLFNPQRPSEHVLQFDLAGTCGDLWNERCYILFAEAFVQLRDAQCRNVTQVAKMVKTHRKALKLQWENIQANLSESAQDRATAREFNNRKYSRRAEVCVVPFRFLVFTYCKGRQASIFGLPNAS
jgi:hypothetical protein